MPRIHLVLVLKYLNQLPLLNEILQPIAANHDIDFSESIIGLYFILEPSQEMLNVVEHNSFEYVYHALYVLLQYGNDEHLCLKRGL